MALPSTYKKLRYIETTHTQYIDTGVTPDQNTRVVAHFYFVEGEAWLFGSRQGGFGTNSFAFSRIGGDVLMRFSYGTNVSQNAILEGDLLVDANKNVCTYSSGDTEYTLTNPTATFTVPRTMYLLGANIGGVANIATSGTRLYSSQIYDDGTLVRNFIPAMRVSDSVVGLYDDVNDTFYTNAGTGTFGYLESVTVSANIQPSDAGAVSGTGEYGKGESAVLRATPNDGWQFVGWYLNSSPLSTSNTYTYTPISNVTIEARFDRVFSIDDRVDGDGAIQYTRGTDKNDVTFSVIPDTNRHFDRYEVIVNGETETYAYTPLSLHLTSDIIITAFILDDEHFHIYASTDFKYGSIFVSDNDVYSGTVVTLWARPFPDYNFVRWQDGVYENPRSIVVTENVTLVAEYQRVSDTNGIYQYRAFVKDQLEMESPPKAFMRVDTFQVRTDLVTNATSSIKVFEMPSNINEGDVLVLYDPKGQFLYNGVINSIEDLTIGCSQMQSYYKGNWIYSRSSQDYLEHEIAVVLKDYADGKLKGSTYTDALVAQRLGGVTIDYTGATTVSLPTSWEGDDDSSKFEVVEMEDFIYSLYEKYNIIFDFEINFSGKNYVHIKIPTFEKIKVGNNMYAIQNMLPITEIEETNKLVIYDSNNNYRTTYVATNTGIVENPATTVGRFNVTNTEIVFSDDPVADLVASNLPQTMFNHKLEFDLIIKNFIYQFGDFNLGGELDVYYGDEYYNSVLTGYEISKVSNQNITEAHFICGRVRTALTKLLTRGVV